MLLGLIRPTSGSVRLFGRAPGERGHLSRVGSLVEGPAFYPYLSGRDNLRVLARHAGVGRDRIPVVLDQVDLTGRAGDRYGTYSLGMKQRLGVAARAAEGPAPGRPGRAHQRPGPGRHGRHAPARAAPRRRRLHRPALQSPDDRGAGALRPGRHHLRRPAGRGEHRRRVARRIPAAGRRRPAGRGRRLRPRPARRRRGPGPRRRPGSGRAARRRRRGERPPGRRRHRGQRTHLQERSLEQAFFDLTTTIEEPDHA